MNSRSCNLLFLTLFHLCVFQSLFTEHHRHKSFLEVKSYSSPGDKRSCIWIWISGGVKADWVEIGREEEGEQGGGGEKRGDTCCVSIQGLHPSKDPAFAVFGENLLTALTVVKWDGLAFWSISWMSRFLLPRRAKLTIYATRCQHFLSFFLLFRARKISRDMWAHEG